MNGVQCYELFEGIALKNHTFSSFFIGNSHFPFKQSVKNFGFTLDCHLSMKALVSNISRTCYFELRRLTSFRRFLTSTATATLVSAFALSRIDYCCSLLVSLLMM